MSVSALRHHGSQDLDFGETPSPLWVSQGTFQTESHCLPPAQLAASESGPRVLSADRGSYYIRLGDLAPSFRQRAFEHALSHIQHNQFQARAVLAELQEALQVVRTSLIPILDTSNWSLAKCPVG